VKLIDWAKEYGLSDQKVGKGCCWGGGVGGTKGSGFWLETP